MLIFCCCLIFLKSQPLQIIHLGFCPSQVHDLFIKQNFIFIKLKYQKKQLFKLVFSATVQNSNSSSSCIAEDSTTPGFEWPTLVFKTCLMNYVQINGSCFPPLQNGNSITPCISFDHLLGQMKYHES